jgi:hypothetical protein
MTERPRGLKLEIGKTADFSHVWIRREGGSLETDRERIPCAEEDHGRKYIIKNAWISNHGPKAVMKVMHEGARLR